MTWHILTTEPRREFTVASGLIGNRVPVYLPTIQVSVRAAPNTAKPWRFVDRPLFPGYLFAKMACPAAWNAVCRVSGIAGYLRGPEGLKTLSEAAIASVRKIEEDLTRTAQSAAELPFHPGDHIRIDEDGNPWTGLDGIIERLDKHDRAIILLMQRNWRVSVPTGALREAS